MICNSYAQYDNSGGETSLCKITEDILMEPEQFALISNSNCRIILCKTEIFLKKNIDENFAWTYFSWLEE